MCAYIFLRLRFPTFPCVLKSAAAVAVRFSSLVGMLLKREADKNNVYLRSVCAKGVVCKGENCSERLLKSDKNEICAQNGRDVTKNSPKKPRKCSFSIDKLI